MAERSAIAAQRAPSVAWQWLRHLAAPLALWSLLVAFSSGALVGRAHVRGGVRVLLPMVVGAVLVMGGRRAATRLPWRALPLAAVVAAGVWAASLALIDGPSGLTSPLESRYDYLVDVPLVGDSPGLFLDHFTERISAYSTHVRGHPPALLLALWALDRAGLGGAAWAAAVVILAGASAAAAALVAVREVAGEEKARRAAPFLVLAPAAIWIATSADALFMGFGAWGVALLILATGGSGPRSDLQASIGGLILGASLFLTYGAALLVAVVVAVAVARGRLRPIIAGAMGVAIVALAFAVAGFWWFDGLRATAEQYARGAASRRPYARSLSTNIGAFAVTLGPAAAVALARLRDGRVWLLAGGALAAVLIADLSGMSKGEVERIWLLFVPWVLTACAALAGRGWLALQAASGVVVEVVLRSPW